MHAHLHRRQIAEQCWAWRSGRPTRRKEQQQASEKWDLHSSMIGDRQSTKVFIIHHMIFEPRPLSLQQQHTKNLNDKSRWMSSWCYCYCLNLNQIVQSHQGSLVNTSLHCSGLTGKALHRYSEKLQDKLDYFLGALAVRHCP